ncbi:uncharacterized protein KQ657_003427 [Scheffersomyces spartinae]|uniref:PPPDE domain-containing protein n=1 Tax=Scheffersomyces spartinae TaxID=45513 RepID=A0A9P7VDE6_9ASCO|nr:uncharacterized protein KQ657_003427 [Scheffersomyces spartinae]KAG7195657.1 hypothetical protein KQ657_003427 [Scheffersomyces spartinae]
MSDDTDPQYNVKVHVYDLSQGLARVYAPMLLGINLDAIYHTGVVVYDKEHYIDQGVKENYPGNTKYGTPIEVIDVGSTYISPEIFQEYLDELRVDEKYQAHKYDLFENNCNHFTDHMLEFLVGKNLESRILDLPKQVLNSPNGLLLKQMIGSQPIA